MEAALVPPDGENEDERMAREAEVVRRYKTDWDPPVLPMPTPLIERKNFHAYSPPLNISEGSVVDVTFRPAGGRVDPSDHGFGDTNRLATYRSYFQIWIRAEFGGEEEIEPLSKKIVSALLEASDEVTEYEEGAVMVGEGEMAEVIPVKNVVEHINGIDLMVPLNYEELDTKGRVILSVTFLALHKEA